LIAVLLALPLYVATIRKLQALGMLISEMSVKRPVAGERTAGIRAIVANTILVAGVAGLGLLTLVLSSALLPPRNILIVLTLLIAAVAWAEWRAFVRIYAKAQVALEEVWAQPHDSPEPGTDTLPGC
jgi:CPA2 family monovalent cation:H+ antiporter-2